MQVQVWQKSSIAPGSAGPSSLGVVSSVTTTYQLQGVATLVCTLQKFICEEFCEMPVLVTAFTCHFETE